MNITAMTDQVPTQYRAAAANLIEGLRAVANGRRPSNPRAARIMRRKGYIAYNPEHEPFADDLPLYALTAKGERMLRSVEAFR